MSVQCEIITCPQWGAVAPKQGIQTVPKSSRIIMHHTAGHHPEIADSTTESREEAIAYARAIQHFHMADPPAGRGWIDSGHNFLVCRNGLILQGRWLTVSAIQAGHMVMSAHCPGQNNQVGIEHEHKGTEPMTAKQIEASARLIAWISYKYGRRGTPLQLFPHSKYYNTRCPENITVVLPKIYRRAAEILVEES